MDENNMMHKENGEEQGQDQVQEFGEQNAYSDVTEKRANVAQTAKDVLTSSEGVFYAFAFTLMIGFVVCAFTRNGYYVNVKTPNGTEVTVAKENERNDS